MQAKSIFIIVFAQFARIILVAVGMIVLVTLLNKRSQLNIFDRNDYYDFLLNTFNTKTANNFIYLFLIIFGLISLFTIAILDSFAGYRWKRQLIISLRDFSLISLTLGFSVLLYLIISAPTLKFTKGLLFAETNNHVAWAIPLLINISIFITILVLFSNKNSKKIGESTKVFLFFISVFAFLLVNIVQSLVARDNLANTILTISNLLFILILAFVLNKKVKITNPITNTFLFLTLIFSTLVALFNFYNAKMLAVDNNSLATFASPLNVVDVFSILSSSIVALYLIYQTSRWIKSLVIIQKYQKEIKIGANND
ncbi:MSC_0624 family F1-like ATPase-associated membrane protein [Mycoplasma struthionis]|uniref:MSC_0624 family F1-like ATPase-associated membrane protein n=1 Tax=Mycoplasma struthionis TaxID=538220 RepID=UPI003A5C7D0B